MKIKKIILDKFKRFTDLTISEIPETARLVLLVGPNGSGKTSLFEAFNHWYRYYEILLDVNRDLLRALNGQNVPYTIVLNQKGEIVWSHNGYIEGDEFKLQDKLKELAGK